MNENFTFCPISGKYFPYKPNPKLFRREMEIRFRANAKKAKYLLLVYDTDSEIQNPIIQKLFRTEALALEYYKTLQTQRAKGRAQETGTACI